MFLRSRASCRSPFCPSFYDLKNEADLLLKLDQETVLEGLGAGWIFCSASAINDLGDFVGSVCDPDWAATGNGLVRAYAIRTLLNDDPLTWTVKVLPSPDPDSTRVVGRDINWRGAGVDDVDVLCGGFVDGSGGRSLYLFKSDSVCRSSPVQRVWLPVFDHIRL